MAKRIVSFADYQEPEYDQYTGEDPPAGRWFDAKLVRAKYQEDGDQMVFYVSIINHPDYEGWTRGVYAPFEGTRKFVMQEFLKAVQGGLTKDVSLDWENDKAVELWVKKAKPIRIQTREYNERIQVGRTRAILTAIAGGKATTPAAPAVEAYEPDAEPEPDVAAEEPLEDYTEEELAEMPADELVAILTDEFSASVPRKGRRDTDEAYVDKLVNAILDAQEEADDDEPVSQGEDDAEEGDTAGDDADEFDDGFDDGEEEEAEEEPEPAPAPARRSARKAAPPVPASAAKATPARRARR